LGIHYWMSDSMSRLITADEFEEILLLLLLGQK
jgi:hypothetical protein